MRHRPRRCRRTFVGGGAFLVALLALGPGASPAGAAGPPIVGDIWASQVEVRSARLSAEIDPNDSLAGGYFEYVSKAAYDKSGFGGARRVILNTIGQAAGTIIVNFPNISGLDPDTVYLYRLTVTNSFGTVVAPSAPPHPFFRTQALGGALLADNRGWEMVSPVDKDGGAVAAPEAIAGGGLLQAASGGGAVTYSSASSFASGSGAPPASQYVARRAAGGWTTQNITVPIFSGSYDIVDGGAPYRLFSADLARGLLLNGKGCRGEATGCPVPNPTLPGTDAPAGFQNYYLRTTATNSFEALLGPTDLAGKSASDFALDFVGATADLGEVLLETCSRLTAAATDLCGGSDRNLYKWSRATGSISLVDSGLLADLAIEAEAITAPSTLAYYAAAGDLYRYSATTDTTTRLTSSGDVEGALGSASDGSHLYFLRATGLYLCDAAQGSAANGCDSATRVAADADASNYPARTGTARVSSDGTKLAFVATTPLRTWDGNSFDNTDLVTLTPDAEVYLYDSTANRLTCVSCNPTNGRPLGASTLPGAIPNGAGLDLYKPRALSADGRRVFFDSADRLVLNDTNRAGSGEAGASDAYEWEAQGEGSCAKAGGCLSLISSGRDAGPAHFADASADGADAFFLTGASLIVDNFGNSVDSGGVDLYDARVGGGLPVPSVPIACEGDACQALPPEPTEPTLTTLLSGPGNPSVRYRRYGVRAKKRCPKGKRLKTIKRRGKRIKRCVKKPKRHHPSRHYRRHKPARR